VCFYAPAFPGCILLPLLLLLLLLQCPQLRAHWVFTQLLLLLLHSPVMAR